MGSEPIELPSMTFTGSFAGCSSIGADFSGDLKFKVGDVPKVLAEIHGLGAGPFDITLVSRQTRLKGDSVDREWAEAEAPEEGPLEYEETCIGAQCTHFAVPGSGDLAGNFVCEFNVDDPVIVVHGETVCPLYPAETSEEVVEAPVASGPDEGGSPAAMDFAEPEDAEIVAEDPVPLVWVVYPGSGEKWETGVGDKTRFGEFIADFVTWYAVNHEGEAELNAAEYAVIDADGKQRGPRTILKPADFGQEFQVQHTGIPA